MRHGKIKKHKHRRKTSNGGQAPKRTWHHIRPKSRGGKDKTHYNDNEILVDARLHDRLHQLFSNQRLNEIVLLLIFSWDTICPYLEVKEPNTYKERADFISRRKAWDILFGANSTKVSAIEKLIKEFLRTEEDAVKIKIALEMGYAIKAISLEDLEHLISLIKNTVGT